MDYETLIAKRNIRDFRGIKTADGRCIKAGLFIRSCSLKKLSAKEVECLRLMNLKTVIDLRTLEEREQKPEREIAGVQGLNMPIYKAATFGITHEKKYSFATITLPDMPSLYRQMVEDAYSVNALKDIFTEICELPKRGALLWHCSEGKDRCGLVSALFLLLLGVDREAVMADYLYTNHYNWNRAKFYTVMGAISRFSLKFGKSAWLSLIADKTYLNAALDSIISNYGSLDCFFTKALGITEEKREELRNYCLV